MRGRQHQSIEFWREICCHIFYAAHQPLDATCEKKENKIAWKLHQSSWTTVNCIIIFRHSLEKKISFCYSSHGIFTFFNLFSLSHIAMMGNYVINYGIYWNVCNVEERMNIKYVHTSLSINFYEWKKNENCGDGWKKKVDHINCNLRAKQILMRSNRKCLQFCKLI